MTGVGKQRELPVEKYDGIASLEKVLGGGGTAGARGKVVDKAHSLVLERDGGAARGDQDDSPALRVVVCYKLLDFDGKKGYVGWRGVGFEVLELIGGFNVRGCHIAMWYRDAGLGDIAREVGDVEVEVVVERVASDEDEMCLGPRGSKDVG